MLFLPHAVFILFVFAFGLVVGSFLNVLIARLPFEKSVIWPGSRCFTCLQPLRLADNLPVIGYLRLRGKCRHCGAKFSCRYLWVELFTGLAFVGLFMAEVMLNVSRAPGMKNELVMPQGVPTLEAWLFFFVHAFLLAILIAASVIDLQFKIVPPQITIVGTIVGLTASALFPWPWPNTLQNLPADLALFPWNHPANTFPQQDGSPGIPIGLTLWPAWEPFTWAPAGSWRLGLLNGIIGAAVGQFIGRAVKFLFETGFGKEALGIGDADLLMMAGAFLGWQPVAIAFFVGAIVLLPIVLLQRLYETIRQIEPSLDRSIPFGPGIAAGIIICWLGWDLFGELVQTVFFDAWLLGGMVAVMGGGLLAAGTVITVVRGSTEESH